MKKFISYIIFTSALLPACLFSLKRPLYNWDMLPYMALVLKADHPQPQDFHTLTYSLARHSIPPQQYGYLVDSPAHRRQLATDPFYFNRQLPLYAVKPLYIALVRCLYISGIPLTVSTVIPSILGFFFTGLLLFHWLQRHMSSTPSIFIAVCIMYLPFLLMAARTSSPDFMSAFFLLLSFYYIFENPSNIWAPASLLLSVLLRVDNFFLAASLLGLLFFHRRAPLRFTLKQFIGLLALYCISALAILVSTWSWQWNKFYYPTFFKYFGTDRQDPGITQYGSFFYAHLINAIVQSHITLILLLLVLLLKGRRWKGLPFESAFALLLAIVIAGKFILFPYFADRFYIAFYLVLFLLLVTRPTVKIHPR